MSTSSIRTDHHHHRRRRMVNNNSDDTMVSSSISAFPSNSYVHDEISPTRLQEEEEEEPNESFTSAASFSSSQHRLRASPRPIVRPLGIIGSSSTDGKKNSSSSSDIRLVKYLHDVSFPIAYDDRFFEALQRGPGFPYYTWVATLKRSVLEECCCTTVHSETAATTAPVNNATAVPKNDRRDEQHRKEEPIKEDDTDDDEAEESVSSNYRQSLLSSTSGKIDFSKFDQKELMQMSTDKKKKKNRTPTKLSPLMMSAVRKKEGDEEEATITATADANAHSSEDYTILDVLDGRVPRYANAAGIPSSSSSSLSSSRCIGKQEEEEKKKGNGYDEDVVVGVIVCRTRYVKGYFYHRPIGYICNICVDPSVRGLGVGTELLEHACDWYFSSSSNNNNCAVDAEREAAASIYHELNHNAPHIRHLLMGQEEEEEALLMPPPPRGVTEMWLHCWTKETSNVQYYHKRGFGIVGDRLQGYYYIHDQPEDAFVMKRDLFAAEVCAEEEDSDSSVFSSRDTDCADEHKEEEEEQDVSTLRRRKRRIISNANNKQEEGGNNVEEGTATNGSKKNKKKMSMMATATRGTHTKTKKTHSQQQQSHQHYYGLSNIDDDWDTWKVWLEDRFGKGKGKMTSVESTLEALSEMEEPDEAIYGPSTPFFVAFARGMALAVGVFVVGLVVYATLWW